jgi:hypothetical protein
LHSVNRTVNRTGLRDLIQFRAKEVLKNLQRNSGAQKAETTKKKTAAYCVQNATDEIQMLSVLCVKYRRVGGNYGSHMSSVLCTECRYESHMSSVLCTECRYDEWARQLRVPHVICVVRRMAL